VISWVDCVKGWGVNERGQPSDGGFGFGKFLLITEGRDSMSVTPTSAQPPHLIIIIVTALVFQIQALLPADLALQDPVLILIP